MSEFKGTPGPWTAYASQDDRCFYIAQQDGAPFTPDYSDVCGLTCNTWSGERHNVQAANARLIAAAPELLEALVMVRDADDDSGKDGFRRIPGAARSKIDRAIAKALNTDTKGEGHE
ncbi:MAG TPA: hypothetical protein DCQ09_00785 [Alcanivorax sp.]|nr:hypothetical protein [Alcanivorax sp.]